MKKLLTLLGAMFLVSPSLVHASDIGLSTSGSSVTLDIWSPITEQSRTRYYVRALIDFDRYQNGDTVTSCNDGMVSGSSGAGTCSSHRGVSHRKYAEFHRYALGLGLSQAITDRIYGHMGIAVNSYSSDISVGDAEALDFLELGVEFGAGVKPSAGSDIWLVASHETNQKLTSFGVRYTF